MKDKKSKHSYKEALPFNIPDELNWIAQDESGVWWGYTVEPLRNDRGWYENEVGDYARLGMSKPLNWADSLCRVMNGKIVLP